MQKWHQSIGRFAWPAAFVATGALTYTYLDHGRELAAASSGSVVKLKSTATVVHDLRDIARLEALAMHVEKVVDISDHQKAVFGTLPVEDSVLFVATGEVVLGVDLSKIKDEDVTYDVHSKVATIRLPPIETFHARLDEEHSYVHQRKTELLATRNENLEAEARRRAVAEFERAGGDAAVRERAKQQAERSLRALSRSFGADSVSFEWKAPGTEI